MLRLLEIFWGKNSSPIFSELVRARASHPYILLVGTIKPYNFYYQHFLLRPFLSKIFTGPFHRAKMIEQSKTVYTWNKNRLGLQIRPNVKRKLGLIFIFRLKSRSNMIKTIATHFLKLKRYHRAVYNYWSLRAHT